MNKNLETIFRERFIAILRGIAPSDVPPVMEALAKGGIRIVEITFDMLDPETRAKTAESIRHSIAAGMLTGAGTVLEPDMVDAAVEAGAEFIISPNSDEAVIRRTKQLGKLSIPGNFTPAEVVNAYRMGADIVKLFPVLPEWVNYVKVVHSPLPHIPLLVTGGVTTVNAGKILQAGASAVAAGASLVSSELVRAKDWAEITRRAAAFVAAVKAE